MEHRYRVGEFAALTGVSVRTLHYYDRVGLLSPSGRSEAGYRLYSERDLLALQQILTLRYLGFPLKQIGALLAQPDFSLIASMKIQRGALRARIAELEQIVTAAAREFPAAERQALCSYGAAGGWASAARRAAVAASSIASVAGSRMTP